MWKCSCLDLAQFQHSPYDFSIAYELIQFVDKFTCILNTAEHHANQLEVFFTSCSNQCSTELLPPLASSDHSLIFVKVDAKPKSTSDVMFHGTIYHHNKASDLTLQKPYFSVLFKGTLSRVASFISKWIPSSIEGFIPHKKCQQKANSQPWFMPECTVTLAHCILFIKGNGLAEPLCH